MKKYKVLFCDLDGTLIDTLSGEKFPKGIWDMKFKFEVLEAIKKLAPEYVFIVTNQGGIEKGFVNRLSFQRKLNYVMSVVQYYSEIDVVDGMYCSTNNKEDEFRKPNTGMLESFYNDCISGYNFNKKDALMIGDASGLEGQFSDSDKKAAENFGIDYLDVNEFVNKYK